MIWKFVSMMFARKIATFASGVLVAMVTAKHGWIFGDVFKAFNIDPANHDVILGAVEYTIASIPAALSWIASWHKEHQHATLRELLGDILTGATSNEVKEKIQSYTPQIQAAVNAVVAEGIARGTAGRAVAVEQPKPPMFPPAAAAVLLLAVFLTGCAATRDGIFADTSTVFGLQVTMTDASTSTPKIQMGLIRNELVRINTNSVAGTQTLIATDAESYGFWKGERVHTVFSLGSNAVSQPSAGRQMPFDNGSMTTNQPTWQPAQ